MLAEIERLTGTLDAPPDVLPFYAIVNVANRSTVPPEVRDKRGVVLGRTLDGDKWLYTVAIESLDESYVLPHDVLEFTGKTASSADFFAGESIKVRVDKNGKGRVVSRTSRRKPR